MTDLSCHYLVCGAGAMGLAFCDAVINECSSPDVDIILLDKHAAPGGHWLDAYSFVTLHQPACYYGVHSESLERNRDAHDLSSRQEILAYFQRVLDKLRATGRLRFFAESEYVGGTDFKTKGGDAVTVELRAGGKVVDATYVQSLVPSICPPKYEVDPSVTLCPVNGLSSLQLAADSRDFVIIGAGKTAMDAVVHLLRNDVAQERIHWIMPNDSWVIRRDYMDPTRLDKQLLDFKLWQTAADLEELVLISEEKGAMLARLDPDVMPRNFKAATLSDDELQLLRSVKDVVRRGRVQAVGAAAITWQNGGAAWAYPPGKDLVFVDCSANGLRGRPPRPIFEEGRITLQSALMAQICPSGAVIGWLECHGRHMSDKQKNETVIPCPHPATTRDLVKTVLLNMRNTFHLSSVKGFSRFWNNSRLNQDSHTSLRGYLGLLANAWMTYDMYRENSVVLGNLNRIFMEEFSSAAPIPLHPPKRGRKRLSVEDLMSLAGAGM